MQSALTSPEETSEKAIAPEEESWEAIPRLSEAEKSKGEEEVGDSEKTKPAEDPVERDDDEAPASEETPEDPKGEKTACEGGAPVVSEEGQESTTEESSKDSEKEKPPSSEKKDSLDSEDLSSAEGPSLEELTLNMKRESESHGGPSEKRVPPPSRPVAPIPTDQIFHLKWTFFNRISCPIVTQNKNGPCPIIAIANILLLRGEN